MLMQLHLEINHRFTWRFTLDPLHGFSGWRFKKSTSAFGLTIGTLQGHFGVFSDGSVVNPGTADEILGSVIGS